MAAKPTHEFVPGELQRTLEGDDDVDVTQTVASFDLADPMVGHPHQLGELGSREPLGDPPNPDAVTELDGKRVAVVGWRHGRSVQSDTPPESIALSIHFVVLSVDYVP